MIDEPLHNPEECLYNLQIEYFNAYGRIYFLTYELKVNQTNPYLCFCSIVS